MSALDLVWDLAGRPEPVASAASLLQDHPGVCRVTGRQESRTAPLAKALGTNWTDHSLWARPDSDRIGPAALWACSGRPPASLRMWSIVAASGRALAPSAEKAWIRGRPGLHLTNRGNPREVISILTDPPAGQWLVSIAVSGQKHVLPYASVQHSQDRWVVRMEATTVTSTPAEFAAVLVAAATLRAAGHRDGDITAGTPTMSALTDSAALDWWRRWSTLLNTHTRSPLLALALWAITKETVHEHAHPRP